MAASDLNSRQVTIAHLVNPVRAPVTSDLRVAQPITFESLRRARAHARNDASVGLFSAQYDEDHAIVPADFIKTRDLDRSVLDLGSFARPRKLPLLKDIVERLYEASGDADYLIYTNVDIALQPHFYSEVARLIRSGLDAFVINRRTVSDRYTSVAELPDMYADRGRPHPGHDCFVFKRTLYPHFYIPDVCVGTPWSGKSLLWNLAARADRFALFTKLFLTFHVGDARRWNTAAADEYREHNRREIVKLIQWFESRRGPCYNDAALWPYMWNRYERAGFRAPASVRLVARIKQTAERVQRVVGRLRWPSTHTSS